MGNHLSQLQIAEVQGFGHAPFQVSYGFAASNTNSFGCLATVTATQSGPVIPRMTVPATAGNSPSTYDCDPFSSGIVTASLQCPVQNNQIHPGTVTLGFYQVDKSGKTSTKAPGTYEFSCAGNTLPTTLPTIMSTSTVYINVPIQFTKPARTKIITALGSTITGNAVTVSVQGSCSSIKVTSSENTLSTQKKDKDDEKSKTDRQHDNENLGGYRKDGLHTITVAPAKPSFARRNRGHAGPDYTLSEAAKPLILTTTVTVTRTITLSVVTKGTTSITILGALVRVPGTILTITNTPISCSTTAVNIPFTTISSTTTSSTPTSSTSTMTNTGPTICSSGVIINPTPSAGKICGQVGTLAGVIHNSGSGGEVNSASCAQLCVDRTDCVSFSVIDGTCSYYGTSLTEAGFKQGSGSGPYYDRGCYLCAPKRSTNSSTTLATSTSQSSTSSSSMSFTSTSPISISTPNLPITTPPTTTVLTSTASSTDSLILTATENPTTSTSQSSTAFSSTTSTSTSSIATFSTPTLPLTTPPTIPTLTFTASLTNSLTLTAAENPTISTNQPSTASSSTTPISMSSAITSSSSATTATTIATCTSPVASPTTLLSDICGTFGNVRGKANEASLFISSLKDVATCAQACFATSTCASFSFSVGNSGSGCSLRSTSVINLGFKEDLDHSLLTSTPFYDLNCFLPCTGAQGTSIISVSITSTTSPIVLSTKTLSITSTTSPSTTPTGASPVICMTPTLKPNPPSTDTCGKVGVVGEGTNNFQASHHSGDIAACAQSCFEQPKCASFQYQGDNSCSLFSASVTTLGFTEVNNRAASSFYDINCFAPCSATSSGTISGTLTSSTAVTSTSAGSTTTLSSTTPSTTTLSSTTPSTTAVSTTAVNATTSSSTISGTMTPSTTITSTSAGSTTTLDSTTPSTIAVSTTAVSTMAVSAMAVSTTAVNAATSSSTISGTMTPSTTITSTSAGSTTTLDSTTPSTIVVSVTAVSTTAVNTAVSVCASTAIPNPNALPSVLCGEAVLPPLTDVIKFIRFEANGFSIDNKGLAPKCATLCLQTEGCKSFTLDQEKSQPDFVTCTVHSDTKHLSGNKIDTTIKYYDASCYVCAGSSTTTSQSSTSLIIMSPTSAPTNTETTSTTSISITASSTTAPASATTTSSITASSCTSSFVSNATPSAGSICTGKGGNLGSSEVGIFASTSLVITNSDPASTCALFCSTHSNCKAFQIVSQNNQIICNLLDYSLGLAGYTESSNPATGSFYDQACFVISKCSEIGGIQSTSTSAASTITSTSASTTAASTSSIDTSSASTTSASTSASTLFVSTTSAITTSVSPPSASTTSVSIISVSTTSASTTSASTTSASTTSISTTASSNTASICVSAIINPSPPVGNICGQSGDVGKDVHAFKITVLTNSDYPNVVDACANKCLLTSGCLSFIAQPNGNKIRTNCALLSSSLHDASFLQDNKVDTAGQLFDASCYICAGVASITAPTVTLSGPSTTPDSTNLPTVTLPSVTLSIVNLPTTSPLTTTTSSGSTTNAVSITVASTCTGPTINPSPPAGQVCGIAGTISIDDQPKSYSLREEDHPDPISTCADYCLKNSQCRSFRTSDSQNPMTTRCILQSNSVANSKFQASGPAVNSGSGIFYDASCYLPCSTSSTTSSTSSPTSTTSSIAVSQSTTLATATLPYVTLSTSSTTSSIGTTSSISASQSTALATVTLPYVTISTSPTISPTTSPTTSPITSSTTYSISTISSIAASQSTTLASVTLPSMTLPTSSSTFPTTTATSITPAVCNATPNPSRTGLLCNEQGSINNAQIILTISLQSSSNQAGECAALCLKNQLCKSFQVQLTGESNSPPYSCVLFKISLAAMAFEQKTNNKAINVYSDAGCFVCASSVDATVTLVPTNTPATSPATSPSTNNPTTSLTTSPSTTTAATTTAATSALTVSSSTTDPSNTPTTSPSTAASTITAVATTTPTSCTPILKSPPFSSVICGQYGKAENSVIVSKLYKKSETPDPTSACAAACSADSTCKSINVAIADASRNAFCFLRSASLKDSSFQGQMSVTPDGTFYDIGCFTPCPTGQSTTLVTVSTTAPTSTPSNTPSTTTFTPPSPPSTTSSITPSITMSATTATGKAATCTVGSIPVSNIKPPMTASCGTRGPQLSTNLLGKKTISITDKSDPASACAAVCFASMSGDQTCSSFSVLAPSGSGTDFTCFTRSSSVKDLNIKESDKGDGGIFYDLSCYVPCAPSTISSESTLTPTTMTTITKSSKSAHLPYTALDLSLSVSRSASIALPTPSID